MKLGIGERFTLNSILPQQANILIIRRVEELRKLLLPSKNEVKKYEIKLSEGRLTWNDPKYEVDIEIGEIMTEEIKKILKNMDENNELEQKHIGLYDKFLEKEKKDEPTDIAGKN